jgi:hypothetical protein
MLGNDSQEKLFTGTAPDAQDLLQVAEKKTSIVTNMTVV